MRPLFTLVQLLLFLTIVQAQQRRYVVTFVNGSALEQFGSVHQDEEVAVDKWYGRRIIVKPKFPDKFLENVNDLGNVESVEEDLHASGFSAKGQWVMDPSQPYGMYMWMRALPYLNSSQRIHVAMLDSGLSTSVLSTFANDPSPDGYDFVSDESISMDGDGRDATWTDPGDASPSHGCFENSWHGTQTATLLAADPSKNNASFAGALPHHTVVMPIRVLGACKRGYASDVADAIVWAAGGDIRGLGHAEGSAQVIVMPFSGYSGLMGCPSFLQSAINFALERNITMLSAAGNNFGRSAGEYFPGNCKGVIPVGALSKDGKMADYSSTNAEIFMPGGTVEAPLICMSHMQTLKQCMGTSFSVVYGAAWVSLEILDKGDFVGSHSSTTGSSASEWVDPIAQVAQVVGQENVLVYTGWNWCTSIYADTFYYGGSCPGISNKCPYHGCQWGNRLVPGVTGQDKINWDNHISQKTGGRGLDEFCICDTGYTAFVRIGHVATTTSFFCGACSQYSNGICGYNNDDSAPSGYCQKKPAAHDSIGCYGCPDGSFCKGGAYYDNRCLSCFDGCRCNSCTYITHQEPTPCRQCTPGYKVKSFPLGDGNYYYYQCSPTWNRDCVPCPDGEYSNDYNKLQCTPWSAVCKEGEYVDTAPSATVDRHCSACSTCERGWSVKFQNGNWLDCNPSVNSGGNRQCEACGAGKYQMNANQRGCENVPAGYEVSWTSAYRTGFSVCGENKYSTGSVDSCSSCAAGSFSAPAQSSCIQCNAPGMYWNKREINHFDVFSISNQLKSVGATCQEGPPRLSGLVNLVYTLYCCEKCPVGTFHDGVLQSGATTCKSCTFPAVALTMGQGSCTSCGLGRYSVSVTECKNCTAGWYQDQITPSSSCTQCSPGKFAGAERTPSCEECQLGYYGPGSGLQACTFCTPGSYADKTGMSSCVLCPSGKFSDDEAAKYSSSCRQCTGFGYTATDGATVCQNATEDFGVLPNHAGQEKCGTGLVPRYYLNTRSKIVNDGTNDIGCAACPAGYYEADTSEGLCTALPPTPAPTPPPTPAPTPPPTPAPTPYPGCPAGTYSLSGTTQETCFNCSAGTYSTGEKNTNCTKCPEGSIAALPRSASCTPCSAGYYTNGTGQSVCLACGRGYSTYGTKTICRACPSGSYSSGTANYACSACLPGTYSELLASTQCQTCAAGNFSGVANATGCLQCPPGTFSGAASSSSCTNCSGGYFASGSGNSFCRICPAGSYSAMNNASSSCTLCKAGTFSQFEGASMPCSNCSAGTASLLALGSTGCMACAPGTYSNSDVGFAQCSKCAPGTYSSAPQSSQCTACVGTTSYADLVASTSCSTCSATSCSTPSVKEWQSCTRISNRVCIADFATQGGATVYATVGTTDKIKFSEVTSVDILLVGGGGTGTGGAVVLYMDYLIQPAATYSVTVGGAGLDSVFSVVDPVMGSQQILMSAQGGQKNASDPMRKSIVNGVRWMGPVVGSNYAVMAGDASGYTRVNLLNSTYFASVNLCKDFGVSICDESANVTLGQAASNLRQAYGMNKTGSGGSILGGSGIVVIRPRKTLSSDAGSAFGQCYAACMGPTDYFITYESTQSLDIYTDMFLDLLLVSAGQSSATMFVRDAFFPRGQYRVQVGIPQGPTQSVFASYRIDNTSSYAVNATYTTKRDFAVYESKPLASSLGTVPELDTLYGNVTLLTYFGRLNSYSLGNTSVVGRVSIRRSASMPGMCRTQCLGKQLPGASTANSFSLCPPGRFMNASRQCEPCANNTYRDLADQRLHLACTRCPDGFVNVMDGKGGLGGRHPGSCRNWCSWRKLASFSVSSMVSSGTGLYSDVEKHWFAFYSNAQQHTMVLSRMVYADIFMIGGGGGGGSDYGGGGGAGAAYSASNLAFLPGTYVIQVGLGGTSGKPGADTLIWHENKLFLRVRGGSAGGSYKTAPANGGCGGGAPVYNAIYFSRADNVGTNGTCFDGGRSLGASNQSGGGGGAGAGGPGFNYTVERKYIYPAWETTNLGGSGGPGILVDLRGGAEAFGGGGGGYGPKASGGSMVTKVGGDGGYIASVDGIETNYPGQNAEPNTGSGGGGSGVAGIPGGSGSAGAVIMRMHYMWTDPGSVAPFSPLPEDSAAMEAYSIYSNCGVGSFQNESSVGGERQCPLCTEVGTCSFQQVSSGYVCSRCQRCNKREYVESWDLCDGRRQDPFTAKCKSCKLPCKVGQYTNDTCTGMTETNTEYCLNCTQCPYGYFYANHSGLDMYNQFTEEAQVCNGTGVLDSDGSTSCKRCDTCANGQYASNVYRCTGVGIWQDKFKCTDCQPCASGYRHAQDCDGTTFDQTCVECPDCLPGQYKASTWNNITKRTSCTCLECRNNRTCTSLSQYRTFLQCSGKAAYDETCAECPLDSCPMMGTTPNYTNCIEGTRKFECIACPPASPAEVQHLQKVNCTTCPVDDCSKRPGSYIVSRCGASVPAYGRTFTCGLCEGCPVRKYMGSWKTCDGTTDYPQNFNKDTMCKDCQGVCKVGQYAARLCTGRDLYDVEKADGNLCRTCTSCKFGFYHTTHTKVAISKLPPTIITGLVTEKACNGYGMFDSDGVTDCVRCDTCPNGQYAIDVGNCTGNGIWKVPFKCTACQPCPSGYQHDSPCDGTTFNDKCKLCEPCPRGSYISSYWNATSMRMVCGCSFCRVGSCASNQYRTNVTCSGNATYDEACANCSSCNSGEYIAAGGKLCNGLGFVDSSAGLCKPCRTACSPGYFLNGTMCLTGMDTVNTECSPCSSKCPFGFYSYGRCDGTSTYDTRKCLPCSSCAVGQIQTAFCYGNTTEDVTACKTCNVTSCPPPQILVNQCSGLETVDRSQCATCGKLCSKEEYTSKLCSFSSASSAANTSLYDGICTVCTSRCPPNHYVRIACTGSTANDTLCSPCRPNGCSSGEYIASACDGTSAKDTTQCQPCTCPSGSYAPNNTCSSGKTLSNNLACVACTSSSTCASGQYLAGTCSTFSNPFCVACRPACGPAEIEVQACTRTTDRRCLPNPACFSECPSGTYESRACRPPNIVQVCTPCSKCPAGSFISGVCKGSNDTQCSPCTAPHCPSRAYNGNFGLPGGCTGSEEITETASVQCGTLTESFGQPCSPNSYRFQSRIKMQDAWDNIVNGTMMNPASDLLSFDVLQEDNVYAYGYKSTIRTFDYLTPVKAGVFAEAYLPEVWMTISDIRFSPKDKSIYVNIQQADTVFRCDATCPYGNFVRDPSSGDWTCETPYWLNTWKSRDLKVQCSVWATFFSLSAPPFGYAMQGGCHVFRPGISMMVCASGTFRADDSEPCARIWTLNTGAYRDRDVQDSLYFSSFGQMIGPPAYNRVTRSLYLFTYKPGLGVTRPYNMFQMRFDESGDRSFNLFQLYSHVDTSRKVPSSLVGASIRLDTNQLLLVDESVRSVFAFQMPYYADESVVPVYNASYGTLAYKDVEFIASTHEEDMVDLWDKSNQLAKLPSKLFFTSLEIPGDARAELYVQCAPCKDGGLTNPLKAALSQSDCISCRPGFYKLSNNSGCVACNCSVGEYATGQQCTNGTDLFNVACKSCRLDCASGSYINGTCSGTASFDETSCPPCNTASFNRCPVSLLPQAPQEQDALCVGYDCLRRQALFYPLDGWDLERDIGPRSRTLVPMSMSLYSSGPTPNFVEWRTGGSSASFNASSHEYYIVPPISGLFDRMLGYRIVSNVSMWEQGMTIAFWIRTAASSRQEATIFELSNGFDTEQIYVRISYAGEFVVGVTHSAKSVQKEFTTSGGSVAQANTWQHLAWTVLPVPGSGYYDATWSIFIDGNATFINIAGVMPMDGSYTANFIGYSSSSFSTTTFFSGQLDDLRLYERALTASSVASLFGMHDCCSGLVSGSYVDTRRTCSGREHFDQHPCKQCRSDCGPMYFIDNWQKRCVAGSTTDQTLCKACSSCGVDQYMGRVCSGTAFYEEALCYQCKYSSNADCPAGTIVAGRCDGSHDRDTSMCVNCQARCIGWQQDPQSIGQYISRACVQSSLDYVCTPCQEFCPVGTYIANRCDGMGTADTGCSLCRNKCRPAERGITAGEYVQGSCAGNTFGDVQSCAGCRTCPNGTWATQMCTGVDFSDTTQCEPCITSCSNQSYYYVKGDCVLEKATCALCDPPCDPALFDTVRECGNNLNRICKPKTKCNEQCPAGYYTKNQCIGDAKVCYKCSSCASGFYGKTACSLNEDTKCERCTSSCVAARNYTNGMIGSCSSGTDVQDAVQCTWSATPVAQACAANEWLSASLSEAVWTETTSILQDTGSPSVASHPFRSDISSDGALVAYLVTTGQTDATRQTLVKVVQNDGVLVNYVFPRAAYFSRLDYFGSNRGGVYPTAKTSAWDATDVMLSADKSFVYIFFSQTYDFIAKCALSSVVREISSSSCTYLSTVQFNATLTTPSFVHLGCVRMTSTGMACTYEASSAYAVVMLVKEADGLKTELLGDGYSGLGRPLSPPAYDASSLYLYMLCEIFSSQVVLRINPQLQRNAGVTIASSFGQGSFRSQYHSLVFLASPKQLVAANYTGILAMSGTNYDVRSSRDLVVNSMKDLATFVGSSQLYMLVHASRGWSMYTHCAPCPSNSWSPAGIVQSGIEHACLCSDDYYGAIQRPVVDKCKACLNAGTSSSGNLLKNACPVNMYKTNIRCTGGTPVDTTCAPCISHCRMGSTTAPFYAGQYITATCDGNSNKSSVDCAECASSCPDKDVYSDTSIVCSGTAFFDERLASSCKPCRPGGCGSGRYITNRCLPGSTRDTTDCTECSACSLDNYISKPCNGSTFYDTRQCSLCKYNATSCGAGSYTINLCTSGRDVQDTTKCSTCNQNCKPANFSSGYAGQFIFAACASGGDGNNQCANCISSCGAGMFVSSACTGLTQTDTQCSPCRSRCASDEFIAGTCGGISLVDATNCTKCTARPSTLHYTKNPCDGTTRSDQTWLLSSAVCGRGQYIAADPTSTETIQCKDCKTTCPPGFYMQGTCQGNKYTDEVSCVACSSCPKGQYRQGLLSTCNGTNTIDTVQCVDCRFVYYVLSSMGHARSYVC